MPIKNICKTCGKVIYKSPSQYKNAKHYFCSRGCFLKYRAERPNEYKKYF